MNRILTLAILVVLWCTPFGIGSVFGQGSITVVNPEEYAHAFANPLKGFRSDTSSASFQHEYVTITRCYIRWNEIENDESDTVEKIKAYCDKKWKDVEKHNIKVIPRVYLDWDQKPGNEYWPADMATADYKSEQFKKRLVRLIERLGQCWDNDPRVAWVQMGLIGFWGEHHSPSVTPEMQKLMGDAFMKAFKNKKILVRRADNFSDYAFGIYWDSWAHIQEMPGHQHGKGIEKVNTEKGRWKISPIEGETAYNWGKYAIQPGDSPNDTLTDPVHLDYLLDSIRRLHCSGLGWVANYNGTDPKVHQGAEEVQKAFGYRFIIKKFSCPRKIEFDKPFPVEFSVVNTGSAPLYENRPIEFSLLDPKTRKPVWKTILNGDCDLRSWLPGDDWDETNNLYRVPAKEYSVRVNLSLSSSNGTPVPQGQYIAALAVLDPIGLEPNLRFAIRNYFSGGRHPFCRVGVETDPSGDTQLDPADFDDLAKDSRLPYALIPTQKK